MNEKRSKKTPPILKGEYLGLLWDAVAKLACQSAISFPDPADGLRCPGKWWLPGEAGIWFSNLPLIRGMLLAFVCVSGTLEPSCTLQDEPGKTVSFFRIRTELG